MKVESKPVSEAEQLLSLLDQMHAEASGPRGPAHNKLKNVTKEIPETNVDKAPLESWSPLFAQMRSRLLDTISEIRHAQQSIADAELPG